MPTEVEYYQRFQSFTKDQLFDLVRNKEGYEELALQAALKVVEERGLQAELAKLPHPKAKVDWSSDEASIRRELKKYFSEIAYEEQFREETNYIYVLHSEAANFEAVVKAAGLRPQPVDGGVNGAAPPKDTICYFFPTKDLDKVNAIIWEMQGNETEKTTRFDFYKVANIALSILIALVIFAVLLAYFLE